MKWQGGRKSDNFEDRRGMSGGQKLTLGRRWNNCIDYWIFDGGRSSAIITTGAKYDWYRANWTAKRN